MNRTGFDASLSRREVLAVLGGFAGLGVLPMRHVKPPITKWGVQLYTLRSVANADLDGTLKTLGEIGYREVETHSYYGRTAAEIRKALDAAGLTAPAAHVSLNAMTSGLPKLLEDAATIGHKWLVVPSLPGSLTSSADGFKQAGEQLAKAADVAKGAGIRIAFHNHAGEFRRWPDASGQPGPTGMDIILQSSPADAVFAELDVYWIVKGGGEPLAFLDKWKGRVKMLHLKDATAAPEIAMRDVGAGTIDWPAILKKAEDQGLEHAFVEHDSPGDAVASVRASFQYLSKLRK
jgi:sugar phosphate isomerase/epimerase